MAQGPETLDGNVLRGKITGLAPLLTVETARGDTLPIQQENIDYIRFSGKLAPPTTKLPLGPAPECIPALMEKYRILNWGVSLGLGYFVAGVTGRNGFGYPNHAIGVIATLGLFYRWYMTPNPLEIERLLSERCGEVCAGIDLDKMTTEAIRCLGIGRFFYLQVGSDFVVLIPSVGGGVQITLGSNVFFDLGVVWNPNFLWFPPLLPYLGVILTF